MGGRWLSARRAGTALVGDGPTVAARINEYARLASTALCFRAIRIWKKRIGRRVAVPTSGCRHSGNSPAAPLNPQGEAVANDFIPRKVAQAKEEIMATPVKKWLLRVAPGFYRWASWRCGNWPPQLAGCDAYFALTGRGGDGVLDALRRGELWQHLAISSWRALIGFSLADRWG